MCIRDERYIESLFVYSPEELPKAVALQNQRPKGAGSIDDINLNGFGELIWKGFPLESIREEPRRAAEGSSLTEPAP